MAPLPEPVIHALIPEQYSRDQVLAVVASRRSEQYAEKVRAAYDFLDQRYSSRAHDRFRAGPDLTGMGLALDDAAYIIGHWHRTLPDHLQE